MVDVFRFFAGAARCLNGLAAGEYLEGHTSMIRRDPVGVVASIAPWNYPLMMAAWKLAPALAAGNCVVIKPSEITPLTALKLGELAKDIFPAGVVNVLFGRGKTVGDPLTGHDKVRMVSLTGSIATGEHIIGHTASSIKRTHMELGGKAPVIVFDDADWTRLSKGCERLVSTMPGRTVRRPAAFMPRKAYILRWLKSWVLRSPASKWGRRKMPLLNWGRSARPLTFHASVRLSIRRKRSVISAL